MTARWYIVHAYSNFEKKVAEDIEHKAKQKGLGDLIEQIIVPTEKVVAARWTPSASSSRAMCWCARL
jgi:transcriptional antiterminator NusG